MNNRLTKKTVGALLCLAITSTAMPSLARADDALPRDPANVYGTLENGLKYVIRHNANPPGRVNFYLHVKTGALNESDDQNGIAHFMEHMAFNGSTHFPPGKLLPLLGGLGMTFGADTNAHTNLWETLYKLNLPDTQPKTIDLAARIFSDYASGLTLSDEEINNERNVILGEYRAGTGPGKRLGNMMMRDVFAGTRLAKHDVIGDAEQIKTFTPDQFRNYYNTWYQPKNMTLIVVGDVTPEQVLPSAIKWLSGISARTPEKPPQTAGLKPTTQPQAYVYTDGEQVEGTVSLTNIGAPESAMTTYDQYRKQVLRAIASEIVNRRYRNLITAGKASFRGAGVDIDPFLYEGTLASAEASGEPGEWKPILTGLVTEIHRAVEHGFTESEMKLIVRGLTADAERDVVAESTRESTTVVNALARNVGRSLPMLSAQQELDLLKRVTATLTVDDLNRAFKDAFGTDKFSYVLNLPAERPGLAIPKAEDVLAAADATWKSKAEAPKESLAAESLLSAEPAAGAVAAQETDAALGVSTLTFANGVVLHHKFTDNRKDRVLVTFTLPGGQLEETDANRGVSDLAGVIVDRPATSRLASDQIADLLTGKTVTLGGGIGTDSLMLQITASNKDLPIGMQLAYALLTDGKLEPAAVEDWKKNELQTIAAEETQPRPHIQRALSKTVYGGDARFRPIVAEDVKRLTGEQAEAWFKRIAGGSAIEVTIVGDIKLDNAMKLAATYVGSLPKRERGFDALDGVRKLDRAAGPFKADGTFTSVTPQALAVAGFISCDALSPDRRPLALAADILTNRMVDRIREKEQLVYSIGARNTPSRYIPETGLMSAGAPTDPANGAKLADTVLDMIADFAKTGPTAEELATAKKQVITQIATQMRDPGFWSLQLSEITYRKARLADLKEIPAIYDTFTADDLKNVVAKYATPERTVRLVVTPKAGAAAAVKGPATQPTTKP